MASELSWNNKATPTTTTGGVVIDSSGQTDTTARLELKADRPSADQDACDIRFYNNNAQPIAVIAAVKGSAKRYRWETRFLHDEREASHHIQGRRRFAWPRHSSSHHNQTFAISHRHKRWRLSYCSWKSPILAFDVTDSGTGTILTDGGH